MTLDFEITPQDIKATQLITEKYRKEILNSSWSYKTYRFLSSAMILIFMACLFKALDDQRLKILTLIVAGYFLVIFLIFKLQSNLVEKLLSRDKNDKTIPPNNLSISVTSEGLLIKNPKFSQLVEWNEIKNISSADDYDAIYLNRLFVILVPKRVYVTSDQQNQFVELIQNRAQKI